MKQKRFRKTTARVGFHIAAIVSGVGFAGSGQAVAEGVEIDCSYNGVPLFGKVEVVESFPDFKVKAVTSFPDLRVQKVDSFPDACGKWQIVESFPDFTIQYVESFPDFTIEYVDSFPGMP